MRSTNKQRKRKCLQKVSKVKIASKMELARCLMVPCSTKMMNSGFIDTPININKMKKPDLRIDTEFFDDNLNGLSIPEAIRVTQSIDTQTFIKEGLSDDSDQLAALSIQTIDRVVSQRLFDNFLSCWGRLK